MKLYHGTNGAWLSNILRHGLQPRGRNKARNNWKHVSHQSSPDAVYLTDNYAPYFAFNASRGNEPQCAVIEVDIDLLNHDSLFPDEDCWEQLGRGRDGIVGDMSKRTLHYRRLIEQDSDASAMFSAPSDHVDGWHLSLRALGTCCHRGVIPPRAVTRAVAWPHKPNARLMFVWDPSITLMNQRIMGDRYRALTALLFGDEPQLKTDDFDCEMKLPEIVGIIRHEFAKEQAA